MSLQPIVAFDDVNFSYESSLETLFSGLTIHFPEGFTGIVGANGAGKSTLLKLVTGSIEPSSGSIQNVADTIYCEQRTDVPPRSLPEFLDDWDADAFELRRRLQIEPDFNTRWNSLSHGERKRSQIAHALWQKPSVFALDEPTNHIDASARALLISSLKEYSGIGLIVSHDRELLDDLCIKCLWLNPPDAQEFAGGYSFAREQRQQNMSSAQKERKKVKAEVKKNQRDLVKKREAASREHSVRSKRGISAKDTDAKEKIDRARVADSKAGQPLRQLGGKSTQLQSRLDDARVVKEYDAGIWLPGSQSRRDALFTIKAGEILLNSKRRLIFPELLMKTSDRIAVTGQNGSGKSTFIKHILSLVNLPSEKLIVMPQEVSAEAAMKILSRARLLNPEQLGHVLNIVSRLGSRPNRLLESESPSPGEIRKLLLALGMIGVPHLIVMDEPTNHLDLPSIEALEVALSGSPCGLLLVSHDQPFLDKLATVRWHLSDDGQGDSQLTVLDHEE
ncbi:MAG: ATPase subunit of ABC transporter with duplicated ATPase domains [Candidatus Azotimanducaceae bacterium]|jgi:ATPase subunit of ABC transporter with duplicated ATPase domains